jgi:hypothetical protein
MLVLLLGCTTSTSYNPDIDPANFVSTIDNMWFPLIPGTRFIYEGVTEDGSERNEVHVTNDEKLIMGVTCTVVRDRVWIDGDLREETFDWYAQDKDGDVWYFGEGSREYEDGVLLGIEGSWEAGIDSALPGIVMKADLQPADQYSQEYYEGEAEDAAQVINLTETVSVAYGTFEYCLKTLEYNLLEPGIWENKFYAAGVGMLLEKQISGGWGQLELVQITAD